MASENTGRPLRYPIGYTPSTKNRMQVDLRVPADFPEYYAVTFAAKLLDTSIRIPGWFYVE
jgi:hypothetical protein